LERVEEELNLTASGILSTEREGQRDRKKPDHERDSNSISSE
jgi:hypothetical protein